MIQFNLLPAVKLDYVKAKRTKRITMLATTSVSVISLLILVLLFANVQLQAKHSRDLSQDIKSQGKKLKDTQDISNILTVQNQLNSLSDLHSAKPEAARVFDYLKQVTPNGVTISNAEIDFEATTMKIKGKAAAISGVNTYADTLKFTTYTVGDEATTHNAFTEVVLSNIATDPATGNATYELNLKFDATIFSNQVTTKLVVPNKVTNSSQLDSSDSVFQSQGGQ